MKENDGDSQRYYRSFSMEDPIEYVKFFEEFGFVVVDGVLDHCDCAASANELWNYLGKRGIKSEDMNTWENESWPEEVCRNGGFMGKFPYIKKIKNLEEVDISTQHQAWINRQNPKVHEVFSHLMENERLWVSIDRYGVMRPTHINLTDDHQGQSEKTIVKEEWKTKKNWLHWDLSPFHFGTSAAGYAPDYKHMTKEDVAKSYGGIRVQGLLNLVDCPIEVGGFQCVPGFHGDRFFKWRISNEEYGETEPIKNRNFVEVPDDDPMRSEVLKVPMRKGSLLVWNSQLPHGNFPNSCDKWRMVQYIKMISVDEPREFKPAIQGKFSKDDWLPSGFKPTDLGNKLFGINQW